MGSLRILIVDDHEAVREGVRSLLSSRTDWVVCGEARNGVEAVEKTKNLRPDVVLMDISMPGMDGVEATRIIRREVPESEVIIVSQNDPTIVLQQAAEIDARACVEKAKLSRDLLAALERVMTDRSERGTKRQDSDRDLEEARAEARASNERLRLAQQIARIGTFEWNIKTGVNHWTPELEAMYGLPPGGFPGTQPAWEQLVHPDDREATVHRVERAMKEGAFEGEWRVVWPDGSVHWILGRASVLKDETGDPGRLVGVNIDVTERKRLEMTLQEGDRRFREMIDALPAAIYTTDAQGRLTHFNPAAVEFSGRVPELGTDQWCISWKMFNSDGTLLPHDECPMAVALKEGRIVDGVEAIAERPNGTRVWFTPYPRPLHDAEDRVVGGINMLVDITQCKQAERANSLLAAIVGCSDDAIISKSLDGMITSWNQAAQRMFGYTPEEAIGKHITIIIPADRRDEETKILERLKRGERIEHFETRRIRKDGLLLDISLTISPVKDGAGRIVGASKVARDITERKRIEQALRESEERYRAIVETTPECVKVVANDGTLLHMNPPGLAMVGASCAEMVVGKSVYDLIAPHDRERFRVFNEEICRGSRGSLEFDIVGLDDVSHHMETNAAPLRMPDGSVVSTCGDE